VSTVPSHRYSLRSQQKARAVKAEEPEEAEEERDIEEGPIIPELYIENQADEPEDSEDDESIPTSQVPSTLPSERLTPAFPLTPAQKQQELPTTPFVNFVHRLMDANANQQNPGSTSYLPPGYTGHVGNTGNIQGGQPQQQPPPQAQNITVVQQPAVPTMPARSHHSAPTFDSSKPRELPRYFDELESLLRAANIHDRTEKKTQARRYAPIEDAELWGSLAENHAASTYEQFRAAVIKLYPGAEDTGRYTLAGVDKLIGETLRLGLYTTEDLGKFYRQFYLMTNFLVTNHRMSAGEQSRAFVRALKPDLWAKVEQRLQLKDLDHPPDEPYALADILRESQYVLRGASYNEPPTHATALSPPQTSPQYVPTAAPEPAIKQEDLYRMFDHFAQTVAALTNNRVGAPGASVPAVAPMVAPRFAPPARGRCNFCGDETHYISRCPMVERYIQDGKIMRNAEGKVVLPSGGFVPSAIQGQWLKDRIDEWYRQIQPQAPKPAGTMMYTIVDSPAVSTMHNTVVDDDFDQRILQLQQEITALSLRKRNQVFDGVEIPVRPKPATNRAPAATTQPAATVPAAAAPPVNVAAQPVALAPTAPQTATRQPIVAPAAVITPGEPAAPAVQMEHPFRAANDANYMPPRDRNYGAAPGGRNQDPAYRTVAPIQDTRIAEEVYKRTMKETAITLSCEELLSLSPEVRQKYKDAILPRRVNAAPPKAAAAMNNVVEEGAVLPFTDEGYSEGGWMIPDPVEAYYQINGREMIRVAKDSHSLRSIMMQVDHKEEIECILDNGSMVVSMSDAVCHALGLTYDPTVTLQMESANGEIDETLGLARNVPFTIGPVTLFFQVHVVPAPAYDILLGRPFDVLTESCVKNFRNETQTITITDPNSGKTIAIPTIQRGHPRFVNPASKRPDFHMQRN
jgi:Aspartyl protease